MSPNYPMNPIIPGFAPDPSVVIVEDTFFLVVSSFHLFPGIPIFASKDLRAWQHIGNAINRVSQLSLQKSSTSLKDTDDCSNGKLLATGGLYAPTIRHRNGTTYIICTNFIHDGPEDYRLENFIVSTKDIWSGAWSDPVYFDFHGIDPSLFWDDDGRAYVQGSSWGESTTITCLKIDIESGKSLSDEKVIWRGFTEVIPEGPHVYKKDGWYYLIIAEGGTSEKHCIAAARSQSIWGPYESCPKNPILSPAAEGQAVQHTGHADLFQDKEQRWWTVLLGVRKCDERYHMGRETFLSEVTWPEDEWPVIQPPQMMSSDSRAQTFLVPPTDPTVDLVYIRDPDFGRFDLSSTGTSVRITPSQADLSDPVGPISFIGRRQRAVEGHAGVKLVTKGEQRSADYKAGIALYKDEHRFVRLHWDSTTSSVVFEVLNRAKEIAQISSFHHSSPDHITYEMRYSGAEIDFRYQVDGGEWLCGGVVDTLVLTDYDFVGPVIGVFATSSDANARPLEFLEFYVD